MNKKEFFQKISNGNILDILGSHFINYEFLFSSLATIELDNSVKVSVLYSNTLQNNEERVCFFKADHPIKDICKIINNFGIADVKIEHIKDIYKLTILQINPIPEATNV